MNKLPKKSLTALSLVLLCATFISALPAQAADLYRPYHWYNTGFYTPDNTNFCYTSSQPDLLIIGASNIYGSATFTYNRTNRQHDTISKHVARACADDYLFDFVPDLSTPPVRFSLSDPTGQVLAHQPTTFGPAHSQYIYSVEISNNNQTTFNVSMDNGTSWQSRQLPTDGLVNVVPAGQSKQAIYGLFLQGGIENSAYTIYYSPDAGLSWQPRSTVKLNAGGSLPPIAYLADFHGPQVSPDTLLVVSGYPGAAIGFGLYYALSTDGGRTFRAVGDDYKNIEYFQLFQTSRYFLYLTRNLTNGYQLLQSYHGSDFAILDLPAPLQAAYLSYGGLRLDQDPDQPDRLYLSGRGMLFFSPNGGQSWQQIATRPGHDPATAETFRLVKDFGDTPPNLLLTSSQSSSLLELHGSLPTDPAPSNDSLYFPATQHNLDGAFRRYWEGHGGLAQFGYPQSEVFNEVNAADGKTYQVQYFERNRFELHPEFAGTPYEVELGLLGNQLTLYRGNEIPFQPLPAAPASAEAFFPLTGHTLGGKFKQYWDSHGGLPIFGYPTSEPFMEKNPDDGQTYLVQYFERNRFELHPENAGTPYEVLLGLLGNTILKQKGWL